MREDVSYPEMNLTCSLVEQIPHNGPNTMQQVQQLFSPIVTTPSWVECSELKFTGMIETR